MLNMTPAANLGSEEAGGGGKVAGSNSLLYEESITSNKTTSLFAGLSLVFLALFWQLANGRRRGFYQRASLALFFTFLFYTINYRTLRIHLYPQMLQLRFGLFTWTVLAQNIASCKRDEPPPLLKYGGAGIHFYQLYGKYHASFNFLEYPRLVIGLKRKAGPVGHISFSTCRPNELSGLIQQIICGRE